MPGCRARGLYIERLTRSLRHAEHKTSLAHARPSPGPSPPAHSNISIERTPAIPHLVSRS
jgi:hypothetical protein